MLTFQAGAEVDVPQFRREWKASLSIGLVSFFAPFADVGLLATTPRLEPPAGRDRRARAVDDEPGGRLRGARRDGLNRELVGKRLMSATFVTDIATVAGLTALFVTPTIWIVPFVVVSVALIVGLPWPRRGSSRATATG